MASNTLLYKVYRNPFHKRGFARSGTALNYKRAPAVGSAVTIRKSGYKPFRRICTEKKHRRGV